MDVAWSRSHVQKADGQHRSWVVMLCPRCGGAILLEVRLGYATGVGAGAVSMTGSVTEIECLPTSSHSAYAVDHLPGDVAEFFEQSRRVSDAGVADAAAVQLRKTLEAAAAHKGISTTRLVDAIRAMIDQGLVTKDFGDLLHHVRKIGNVGAHASSERVSDEELDRAMRFTVQILRNLFEVPGELAILKAEQADPGEETSAE